MIVTTSTLICLALNLLIRGVDCARCVNDLGYNYDNNAAQTCGWIREDEERRQKLCLEDEVASKCPISCGHCCKDDPKYRIKLGQKNNYKCTWIDSKKKINKRCDSFFSKKQLVKDGCPKACGNCVSKVTGITPSPTTTKTDTPTVDHKCVDNADYFYNDDDSKPCTWIRGKVRRETLCLDTDIALNCPLTCGHCCENDPEYRIVLPSGRGVKCSWLDVPRKVKKWCGKFNNNKMVKNGCNKACENCFSRVSVSPTNAPTATPTGGGPTTPPNTDAPTNMPTAAPTAPTAAPTAAPTSAPISAPTSAPTAVPTSAPTAAPTSAPTAAPTSAPTGAPTSAPTGVPTNSPTGVPTSAPTTAPTAAPTSAPTGAPTNAPTGATTSAPTAAPTSSPTAAPTSAPTGVPTSVPTTAPTSAPTAAPTSAPTGSPTNAPTGVPTAAPTGAPTSTPTYECMDSPQAMATDANGSNKNFCSASKSFCDQVTYTQMQSHCPQKCGTCDTCQDSAQFWKLDGSYKDCAGHGITTLADCTEEKIWNTCRLTCERCTA